MDPIEPMTSEADRPCDETSSLPDSDQQVLDQAWQAAPVERPPTPMPPEEEWVVVLDEHEHEHEEYWVDTRGCDQCPGCMFCQESHYDGADEI